ncbi:MAG: UvrD-helicase domain-containing protein [Candidatus Nanopelagicales bacterium]
MRPTERPGAGGLEIGEGPGGSRDELCAVLGFPLSDEQWEAVSTRLEPFAIVAGAGTGKTTVMAARVVWLIATGQVREPEVLGLTFTNKAAAELAERVTRLLARWRERSGVALPAGEPRIATYHSFARQLLAEQGLRVGIEPSSRQLSEVNVLQLAMRVLARIPTLQAEHPMPPALGARMVKLDAELAEQAIGTAQLREFDTMVVRSVLALDKPLQESNLVGQAAASRFELSVLVDELRAEKALRGLDFADQMRFACQLVSSAPDLVESLRRQYKVVLLDEYQDTSIAQRMILVTLFGGHPVTAVGDPLQAIYGWRSASVANLAGFREHFGSPGRPAGAVRILRTNRRSGQAILTAANRLSADLRLRHPDSAELLTPDDPPAQVRAALFDTMIAEREWVAEQIGELLAGGTPPEEIAVLSRVGADVVAMRDSLAARGIPAAVAGREALLARPEAAEVVRTLRVLADPQANDALVALLAGPRWRIGPRDLAVLAARAEELAGGGFHQRREETPQEQLAAAVAGGQRPSPCLLEAVWDPGPAELSPQARERLARLVAEFELLHDRSGRTLVELTHHVTDVLGAQVQQSLAGGDLLGDGLGALIDMVAEFADADGKASLGAFVAWLDLAERLDSPATVELPLAPGAVQLMTVHKAKGLEWPVVFLPNLSCRVFPSKRPSARWTTRPEVVPVELRDDRHVLPAVTAFDGPGLSSYVRACTDHDRAGEDRLGYVAFTRARRLLVGSGHWWGAGKTRHGPSDYLLILRDLDPAGPWAQEPQPDADGLPALNPLRGVGREIAWPQPISAAQRAWAEVGDQVTRWQRELRAGAQIPLAPSAELKSIDADVAALRLRRARHASTGENAGPLVFTTSQVQQLLRDPARLRADLRRPMPQPPRPAARRGAALHAWIEARLGIQPLITDDDLPGAADANVSSDADLLELMANFESLPYANQVPHGLEIPFAVPLGGVVVRGRIDAVFRTSEKPFVWEVVDWKTSDSADPVQLAIYRLAWARQVDAPVEQVAASFVFLRTGRISRPVGLPTAEKLERLVADRLGRW